MTDDVQAVYDALTAGDYDQASALQSTVSPADWMEANGLWAASLEVSRDHRERRVRALAYLVRLGNPGESVASILATLSAGEAAELAAILGLDDASS